MERHLSTSLRMFSAAVPWRQLRTLRITYGDHHKTSRQEGREFFLLPTLPRVVPRLYVTPCTGSIQQRIHIHAPELLGLGSAPQGTTKLLETASDRQPRRTLTALPKKYRKAANAGVMVWMKKLQPKIFISVVIGSLFAYILFGAASERRSAAVSALKHWLQSGAAYLERSRRLILSVDGLSHVQLRVLPAPNLAVVGRQQTPPHWRDRSRN